ncbi:MAG: hypothetical protein ACQESG_06665 [Nanobdellota archaeon]
MNWTRDVLAISFITPYLPKLRSMLQVIRDRLSWSVPLVYAAARVDDCTPDAQARAEELLRRIERRIRRVTLADKGAAYLIGRRMQPS